MLAARQIHIATTAYTASTTIAALQNLRRRGFASQPLSAAPSTAQLPDARQVDQREHGAHRARPRASAARCRARTRTRP